MLRENQLELEVLSQAHGPIHIIGGNEHVFQAQEDQPSWVD